MFQLLLSIISYGSLLLLLMDRTAVIFTAVMFMLGTGLIVYKKSHTGIFQKNKRYFLIPVAVLIVAYVGLTFYNYWLHSIKMQVIASLLHMSIETMLLIGAFVLAVLASYFIYGILQTITTALTDTSSQNSLKRSIVTSFVASVITVILVQVMIGAEVLSMGYVNFMCGVLIVSVVILLLLCLIGRIIPSIAIGAGLFMLISTVNVYVYQFRGRLFEPVDLFSAGTAMNVAENYRLFPIPSGIIIGWGIFAAMLIGFYCLQHKAKSELTAKRRILLLAACAISCVAIFFYASNLNTFHWDMDGVQYTGYILDFVTKFKEISPSEPDNYSTDLIADLADQYGSNEGTRGAGEYPHVIVIMDEAFSDLSVDGAFSTNTEVMPFISSLKENTISGYTLSSVYGGNTANSEYEFLTGHSMAWLSPNAVPYQQYIRSSAYSMVSYLKSGYGYRCMAMHPFLSSGWNRPVAYSHLGFDECYFVEDFPQEDYVREYVSDQEMFEFLIETYEAQKEEPLFIFGVTMQNHGDYAYTGENYTQSISLNDYDEFPEVEQYLSLIHETDKAVEYLISYFENVDEDVVIVFYGDHQPKIRDAFYEAISGTSSSTLDEQQKRFEVPFFIWANYDIEEKDVDCTSLNYLSSYVYDVAGINLPPYNQFLSEMETVIPAINANGFYSLNAGGYLPFDEANEDEARWLSWYEMLQYNDIFDRKHCNRAFFPVLE